ncbi:hypothetical protein AAZV13_15G193800 [Glycine max]
MLLRSPWRIPSLRSCMRRIIFFGFNRLNQLFIVIILKAISLIHKFHKNMLQLNIRMQIKSPTSMVFGMNKICFSLHGCSLPFLVTFFRLSLVVVRRGNSGITFNHIFSILRERRFAKFVMNFAIFLLMIVLFPIVFYMFKRLLMSLPLLVELFPILNILT